MSLFGKREPEPETPKPPPQPAPQRAPSRPPPAQPASQLLTHIARGSTVVGEISGAAELVIDGKVEGKIDLDSRLVVGPKGQVEGEVQARSIEISGHVQGNVRGLERVEILRSGRLEGDMVAPQNGVHIAEGAFFTGKIDMTQGPAKKARKKDGPERGRGASGEAGKLHRSGEKRNLVGTSSADRDKDRRNG